MYEVNTRLAYAIRSVGKGEAAAKVFCGVMNLPPKPKRFYESLHALNNATEKVAKVSMALAAAETLSFNNVSVGSGKVVDAEILSRKCSCHFNGNLHSDECSANYYGNSAGREVEGALLIFNRSEVLHNLRYTQYLGDGDSKAYKAVLESKPYKDVNIEKLECVRHVKKRMGTRLRTLKLKLKGKKLEDKKSLLGRNRLTDAEIDKLQIYYGMAIRNNSGNLSAMKQAIWAIFFHKISTDLNPQHGLCPLGDDSWCGYNRSKLKGDTYKHKHNLPISIMHCIKKVFRDLSSPELLSRCLHAKKRLLFVYGRTTFHWTHTTLNMDPVFCRHSGNIRQKTPLLPRVRYNSRGQEQTAPARRLQKEKSVEKHQRERLWCPPIQISYSEP
ncbi:uncharacterized protein TNCV_59031 [Trichonephila clavipes]|nr:uncharacterized protein TNCV_59031 [Trichonephila clavipes]